jgi:hypothetical protein
MPRLVFSSESGISLGVLVQMLIYRKAERGAMASDFYALLAASAAHPKRPRGVCSKGRTPPERDQV